MPNTVSTRVYQFNANSFWVIAVYFILFLVYFSQLMTMSTAGIILFGSILVGIPLYVRYGNNENIKLRTWDKRPLIFSSAGIQFGLDHYPVEGMETAAIFLESFTGFEYRTPWVGGSGSAHMYNKANGDGNKISFRYQGEVVDFTFCLSSYAQFCMFRAVINDWLAAGVNLALRQAFEDDFIVGEMAYYHTESGIE